MVHHFSDPDSETVCVIFVDRVTPLTYAVVICQIRQLWCSLNVVMNCKTT